MKAVLPLLLALAACGPAEEIPTCTPTPGTYSGRMTPRNGAGYVEANVTVSGRMLAIEGLYSCKSDGFRPGSDGACEADLACANGVNALARWVGTRCTVTTQNSIFEGVLK